MDKTQVRQTYEVFSNLQFVTYISTQKACITICSTNNESMMNIHGQKGKYNQDGFMWCACSINSIPVIPVIR